MVGPALYNSHRPGRGPSSAGLLAFRYARSISDKEITPGTKGAVFRSASAQPPEPSAEASATFLYNTFSRPSPLFGRAGPFGPGASLIHPTC